MKISARLACWREARRGRIDARCVQAGTPRVLPEKLRVVMVSGAVGEVSDVMCGARSSAVLSLRLVVDRVNVEVSVIVVSGLLDL